MQLPTDYIEAYNRRQRRLEDFWRSITPWQNRRAQREFKLPPGATTDHALEFLASNDRNGEYGGLWSEPETVMALLDEVQAGQAHYKWGGTDLEDCTITQLDEMLDAFEAGSWHPSN